MIQEALDLRDESDALYELMADLSDDELGQPTQFKNWTLNDIIGHLHIWNWAVYEAHKNEHDFMAFVKQALPFIKAGALKQFERDWLGELKGRALLTHWRDFYRDMAPRFAELDGKQRMKWVGPDMSARSAISARLMESWAHGQAIYDRLGVVRRDTDRIRAIVVLGVNTFDWCYRVRGLTPPAQKPFVKLTAPSGALWEFGEPDEADAIIGSASEFCQTVTQTRHIDDTDLQMTGAGARDWMVKAQCFAGPPNEPPPAGTRFTRT